MYAHGMDPADLTDLTDGDLEEIGRQGERMLAWVESAQEEIGRIAATGESASGQVRATVDPNGRVLDVAFGPRALRLDSRTLAEEVLEAVRVGREEAERQAYELMRAALPGFDPAAATSQLHRLLDT
ncbi:MAG TPA: YbaB/EbfC family nucleoid-associated protein [Nonomuraea sp.]|nr:YbaB/EbfC family nucleoid-associated protein [Nonomuraea sp.]